LEALEVTLRLETDHAAAPRTTIAAQQKANRESIKKGQNESMSPRPSDFAHRANFRPGPQIITALLINILENDYDRQYHQFTFWGYVTYPFVPGR
jgi:lipopolysaccharide export LptBFGC system permease protein LptF